MQIRLHIRHMSIYIYNFWAAIYGVAQSWTRLKQLSISFLFYNEITFNSSDCETERHSVGSNSLRSHGLYSPWNSPGQSTGVVSHSFLHGIFPTQGSNPSLPHCRQILYQLSHQGCKLPDDG